MIIPFVVKVVHCVQRLDVVRVTMLVITLLEVIVEVEVVVPPVIGLALAMERASPLLLVLVLVTPDAIEVIIALGVRLIIGCETFAALITLELGATELL